MSFAHFFFLIGLFGFVLRVHPLSDIKLANTFSRPVAFHFLSRVRNTDAFDFARVRCVHFLLLSLALFGVASKKALPSPDHKDVPLCFLLTVLT